MYTYSRYRNRVNKIKDYSIKKTMELGKKELQKFTKSQNILEIKLNL